MHMNLNVYIFLLLVLCNVLNAQTTPLITERVNSNQIDNVWVPEYRERVEYDANGDFRVRYYDEYDQLTQNWTPSYEYYVVRNENRQVYLSIRKAHSYIYNDQGEQENVLVKSTTSSDFDDFGNRTLYQRLEETTFEDGRTEITYGRKNEYFFQEEDCLWQVIYSDYDIEESEYIPFYKTTNLIFEDCQVRKVTNSTYVNNNWDDFHQNVFSYNEEDQLIKEEQSTKIGGEWVLEWQIDYTYYPDGQLATKSSEKLEGNYVLTHEEYFYEDDFTKRFEYRTNDPTLAPSLRHEVWEKYDEEYNYNAFSRFITSEGVEYKTSRNYFYEYDTEGKLSKALLVYQEYENEVMTRLDSLERNYYYRCDDVLEREESHWLQNSSVFGNSAPFKVDFIYTQKANCETPDNLEDEMLLFPNPTSNYLILEHPLLSIQGTNLEVLDATGKRMFKYNNFISRTHQFDVSFLPKGIYFIRLQNADQSVKSKFIKQ